MWSPFKRSGQECSRFRESLERNADVAALSPALREHAAACKDCQAAAEDAFMSGALLKALPSQAETPRPWFAPRVMAAIAAREVELRRSMETWTVVPRLAAKLSWVCALALLLAGTWLYQTPRSTPTKTTLTDLAGDPYLETAPATTQDDVLVGLVEKGQ
jgi:hypothetical protein